MLCAPPSEMSFGVTALLLIYVPKFWIVVFCVVWFVPQILAEKSLLSDFWRPIISLIVLGKGLGSKYLKRTLREQADAQQLPVMLATFEEKSVTFYNRL